MLNEPVLNYDFALEDAAAAGGWQEANRYTVWVGRQAPDAQQYEVLERREQGILRLPLRSRLMHLIPAGTPYRVAHLFGPWRASDADTIYLRFVQDDQVYHTLLTAMSRLVKTDRLLFLCPACGAEMGSQDFDTARHGLNAFWPFLLEEARRFNDDEARRLCAACSHHHPTCYGFDAEADTAAEAAARTAW
jgi:hypothetical protein